MKQATSIIIVFVLMLPAINRVWIIIDFKINQDYIAKVLCINKDKPNSTCNGKCHLKKRLKKAEEKEQEKVPKTIKENILNFFLPEGDLLTNLMQTSKEKACFVFKPSLKNSSYISRLFRPPQII